VTAKGTVSQKHQAAISRAKAAKDRADQAYRDAIRAAHTDPAEKASIRQLAEVTGLSPNTVRSIIDGT
jgi:DNA-binding GntR family transcriptional regulator